MKKFVIFLLVLFSSCNLFLYDNIKNDEIITYAVAVPYLYNNVSLETYYGGSTTFNSDLLFVVLRTEYISNTIFWENNQSESMELDNPKPRDSTVFKLKFPAGFHSVNISETNLEFIHTTDSEFIYSVYSSENMKSEYFIQPYSSININGNIKIVYRLSLVDEIESQININKLISPISIQPVMYYTSARWSYTNIITTNEYDFYLRASWEGLTNFTDIAVTQEHFDILQALEDKYYPLSGKGHFTITNWP